MKIAGSGSRKLALNENLFERVVDSLCVTLTHRAPSGLTLFSGGAEGFDHALVLAALGAGVPYHLFLPSPDYGKYYWHEHTLGGESRFDEFEAMVEGAVSVTMVSSWHEWGRANAKRNLAMVNAADKVWVWDPRSSGTRHAVDAATRLHKPMFLWSEDRLV